MKKDNKVVKGSQVVGSNLKHIGSIEEMTKSVLFNIASFIKAELKSPAKDAVWPRKYKTVVSNGKNQLVAGRLEFQKFPHAKESTKQLGSFFGSRSNFRGFYVQEEDGTEHVLDLAHDALFYADFGDRYDTTSDITANKKLKNDNK